MVAMVSPTSMIWPGLMGTLNTAPVTSAFSMTIGRLPLAVIPTPSISRGIRPAKAPDGCGGQNGHDDGEEDP